MKIKRFKSYLRGGRYPIWVRFTVGGLVLKIQNLQTQIDSEKNVQKQNKLISKQNSLLSYISGLSVGVGSSDNVLLKRLKRVSGGVKI